MFCILLGFAIDFSGNVLKPRTRLAFFFSLLMEHISALRNLCLFFNVIWIKIIRLHSERNSNKVFEQILS